MAVPNTNTFTLQDVANEFGLGASDGLQDCFNDSTDGGFDSAYKGSKDRLSNFRNYDGVYYTSFTGTAIGSVSSVCSNTQNITYYHNGTNSLPIVGDAVYTDSTGTPLVFGYYVSGIEKIEITGSLGIVNSLSYCLV